MRSSLRVMPKNVSALVKAKATKSWPWGASKPTPGLEAFVIGERPWLAAWPELPSKPVTPCYVCSVQGRINHGAKRAMAQGPPPP